MKKILCVVSSLALLLFAVGCEENEDLKTIEVAIQLTVDGQAFAAEGVNVELVDAAGTASFIEATDANGIALFKVPAGAYTASTTYKTSADGVRFVYTGSNSSIMVAEGLDKPFEIALQKVESQQIIIKELYTTGCTAKDGDGKDISTTDDAYVVLYNNSDIEADASNIVFGVVAPSNGQATNKFYEGDVLKYENADWIPAYSALWWFTSEVKIPAYSHIVVALFGAVNHTETYSTSVNLSDPAYYWMSNQKIAAITNKKYKVAETIDKSHYLDGCLFNAGNAWVVSNSAPAFFIAKMDSTSVRTLCTNTGDFDTTAGATNVGWAPKFPQANVVDAVEVWASTSVKTSHYRFPSKINTGYVDLTNKLGYTVYRNVDKEATEALPENKDKLVYDYSGGTYDETTKEGSTDPSGIDAEASIKAGAHIIYSETNNSGKDFHARKISSLK
ncbi:MAG: DUF4876 domain-containing protein [Bacteroidales bacterium]|nr:DUF4876 domain-containing protein [Bacteroidales bacterium]